MDKLNILCGASLFSKVVIRKSRLKIQFICDENLSKSGNFFEGIEIINYSTIEELLQHNEVNMFLANRYASETVKKLEKYFQNNNFGLFGFTSDDLSSYTKIIDIFDYYKKCDLIKKTIFSVGTSVRFENLGNGKILILTMKKVGTISIREGLEKVFGEPQMHIHSFNCNPTGLEKEIMTPYLQEAIMKIRERIKIGKELRVITSVREPVSRNISFMFYILPRLLGEYAYVPNTLKSKNAYTEIFEDMYYKFINHDYVLNWFDDEVYKYLGINIYEYPFDKEKGYSIIEKGNIKLLVLKLEKLNECVQVIRQFTGAKNFELAKENSSNDYWYKPIYDNFKKNFIPNREYLNKLYGSKFMQYFYSDNEIEAFYKKWLRIL